MTRSERVVSTLAQAVPGLPGESKRKVTVALCVWASSSLLCLTGQVDGPTYAEIVKWMLGLYGAANVGEHITKRMRPTDPAG